MLFFRITDILYDKSRRKGRKNNQCKNNLPVHVDMVFDSRSRTDLVMDVWRFKLFMGRRIYNGILVYAKTIYLQKIKLPVLAFIASIICGWQNEAFAAPIWGACTLYYLIKNLLCLNRRCGYGLDIQLELCA